MINTLWFSWEEVPGGVPSTETWSNGPPGAGRGREGAGGKAGRGVSVGRRQSVYLGGWQALELDGGDMSECTECHGTAHVQMAGTGPLSHAYFATIPRRTRERSERRARQVGEVRRAGRAARSPLLRGTCGLPLPPASQDPADPEPGFPLAGIFPLGTGNVPTPSLRRNPSLLPHLVKRQAVSHRVARLHK